jgi:hypothetical protein
VTVFRDSALVGAQEKAARETPRRTPTVTIVRGVLSLPGSWLSVGHSSLLDASGRKVMDLTPGENDVSRIDPGVYFVRSTADGHQPQATRIVILR